MLGFILRSTNTRNPFEVHYPLKRIVAALIGEDTRLLMSSEWDFVPFTYPMSLEFLPGFILVGAPAPESGHILLTPLAGHEIGHTIWRQLGLADEIEPQLADSIHVSLENLHASKKELFSELKLGDLGLDLLKEDCVENGVMQIEEMFCDLVGLRIFELGYIYAFEYFMAPGGEEPSLEYPSNKRRMEAIKEAAGRLGLKPSAGQPFDNWLEAQSISPREEVMADLIHSACSQFIKYIETEALQAVDNAKLGRCRPDVIADARRAFGFSEPYNGRASLAEIVTAGWLCVLDRNGMAEDTEDFAVLNDVMLKSVEVSEYLVS